MSDKITPAMAQFYEMKEQNPDCILFFRMWDFYEMFDDDALIANKILWIATTSRNKNAKNPTPLAWIPYHAKEKYLPLLVEAGYKVAVAEQVSDPTLKGIVKRKIVRIVTPATIWLEWDKYENGTVNSNIISITYNKNKYGLSILDLSNNKWETCEFNSFDELRTELYKIWPKEVILSKKLFWNTEINETLEKKYNLNIYFFENKKNPFKNLVNHFWTNSLEAFWIQDFTEAQNASSLLLEYLETNQKNSFDFLNKISYLDFNNFIKLDESTIKNLDLVYNLATKSSKNWTLLWILNKTKTPMWSSNLYEQILKPLNNSEEIKKRQTFIEEFLKDKKLLDECRKQLSYISNINSILNRIALNRTSPRDLVNLKKSLISTLELIDLIKKSKNEKLINILK